MSSPWHTVYRELAELLFKTFELTRQPGQDLFKTLSSSPEFMDENHSWFDKIVLNHTHTIDPVHFFSSFNGANISEDNRIRKINVLFAVLKSKTRYREIDFLGCPTPRMIHILAPRDYPVVAEIWDAFNSVVKRGEQGISQTTFTRFKSWYGIDIPSFTIFLFWIDSDNFIALDKNTVNYLMNREIINSEPKNYSQYLSLLENSSLDSYRSVSIIALGDRPPERLSSAPKNVKVRQPDKTRQVDAPEDLPTIPDKDFGDCKLVGLYLFEKTKSELRKVLTPGQFVFYKAFHIDQAQNTISYHPEKDSRIYHQDGFSINISAIVGENGSGKSTISELIYIGLNNLAKKSKSISGRLTYVDGLWMDLYIISGSMYKIMFREEITIERFHYDKHVQKYVDPTIISLDEFNFQQFFYTIAVNYAQYGLNSLQIGDWIRNMFYKNDQYQIPITLTPFRNVGNIDINRENQLLNSRLLSNLLVNIDSFDEADGVENLRKLTKTKYARKIMISLDREKTRIIYKDKGITIERKDIAVYWNNLLTQFKESFKISSDIPEELPSKVNTLVQATWVYIVKKLINIAINYPQYNAFFDPKQNKFAEIKTYLNRLAGNYTHVTHKLRQAIHFLDHNHISKHAVRGVHDFEIDLAELSADIFEKRYQTANDKLDTIHFIPPPIFKVEVVLSGDILFKSLSSGEKQKIYSINSIVYHLKNLDSITNEADLIPYRFANIIFDEVELYFHPEMQKNYIDYFLNYLKLIQFRRLSGLNILFITHSPFILSDIPANNILFLGDTGDTLIRTFGANIHRLLSESFFLKSFMGDFARRTINDLIDYFTLENYIHNPELKKEPWDQDNIFRFIETIGEPLIRDRLLDMYKEEFPPQEKGIIMELQARIKELEDAQTKN